MSNLDKNIGIFPNTGAGPGILPEIRFVGSGNNPISLYVKDNNDLSISSSGTSDILLVNQSGLVANRGNFVNSLTLNNIPVSISGHVHSSNDISSIQFKAATENQWNTNNPVLASGEPGWDSTNGIFKIGNGISSWIDLPSVNYKVNKGSFSLTSSSGTFVVSGGYNVGSLDVFLNGVKLSPNGDYIASNGTSFTLTESAPSGSIVEYLGLSPGLITSSPIKEYEVLNSTKSTFSVTGGYALNNIDVYHNGVRLLASGDYTATNGSTFTLSQPAISGDVVEWLGYSTVPKYQLVLAEVRSDTVDSTNYIGRAVTGSSESDSVWTIKKYVVASNGVDITTTTASNVSWNNRFSSTYV